MNTVARIPMVVTNPRGIRGFNENGEVFDARAGETIYVLPGQAKVLHKDLMDPAVYEAQMAADANAADAEERYLQAKDEAEVNRATSESMLAGGDSSEPKAKAKPKGKANTDGSGDNGS